MYILMIRADAFMAAIMDVYHLCFTPISSALRNIGLELSLISHIYMYVDMKHKKGLIIEAAAYF